jgi:hypothetical protein
MKRPDHGTWQKGQRLLDGAGGGIRTRYQLDISPLFPAQTPFFVSFAHISFKRQKRQYNSIHSPFDGS